MVFNDSTSPIWMLLPSALILNLWDRHSMNSLWKEWVSASKDDLSPSPKGKNCLYSYASLVLHFILVQQCPMIIWLTQLRNVQNWCRRGGFVPTAAKTLPTEHFFDTRRNITIPPLRCGSLIPITRLHRKRNPTWRLNCFPGISWRMKKYLVPIYKVCSLFCVVTYTKLHSSVRLSLRRRQCWWWICG